MDAIGDWESSEVSGYWGQVIIEFQALRLLRVVMCLAPRYNLAIDRTAKELLEEARQLPAGELDWLVQHLLSEVNASGEQAFAVWQREVGEPVPGYEEWFRVGAEALADTSPGIPHEVVMKEFHEQLRQLASERAAR